MPQAAGFIMVARGVATHFPVVCFDRFAAMPYEKSESIRPKNAIVILLGNLSRRVLGAYGGREFATPNLDALARRAIRFDRHCSGSLLCIPAKHDILCGALDFRSIRRRPAWAALESVCCDRALKRAFFNQLVRTTERRRRGARCSRQALGIYAITAQFARAAAMNSESRFLS